MARPQGASRSLEALGQAPHHRDGALICSDANRFLRGQRKAVATLERPARLPVLAVASGSRNSPHHPCAAAAPARAEADNGLIAVAVVRTYLRGVNFGMQCWSEPNGYEAKSRGVQCGLRGLHRGD